jgi:hypothetical protein
MKKRTQNHLRRALASRANGALSRGPVTPAGKRRSSMNAVTHGLSAQSVLLPGESDERFQRLLDGFASDFQPHSHIARFQVEQLAIAAWRMRRAQAFEASFVREQLAQPPGPETPLADTQARVARAWAESSALHATRYETLHTRHFRQHLDRLLALEMPPGGPDVTPNGGEDSGPASDQQNQSISEQNTGMPNEPSPLPEAP